MIQLLKKIARLNQINNELTTETVKIIKNNPEMFRLFNQSQKLKEQFKQKFIVFENEFWQEFKNKNKKYFYNYVRKILKKVKLR